MPRYIDIEPFENLKGITSCCVQTYTQSENTATVRNVKTSDIPTIDPESLRPHGRWVWYELAMDWGLGGWVCSECRARNDNIPAKPDVLPYAWEGSQFCPNCGAKMDLEEDK